MIGFKLIGVYTFQCVICSELAAWELEGDCVVSFVDPAATPEQKQAAIQPVYTQVEADGWGPILKPDGSEGVGCPKCREAAKAAATSPAPAGP